jgi:peptide/nickel transport system substrate-binding protein
LIAEGRQTLDRAERKRDYAEIQTILARDLPYIDFWYMDNVMVHTTRIRDLDLNPSGDYDFLTTVEWAK